MADRPFVQMHPRVVRWTHWLGAAWLGVMIWSGLLIYWAHDPYRIGWGDWTLFRFFPDGFYEALGLTRQLAKGLAYHLVFAWLFFLNGLAYVLYTVVSGQWRHLVPDRAGLRDTGRVLLHDLHLRRGGAPPQGRYNSVQQLSYLGVVAMGAGSLLTGLAIWKPVQLAGLLFLLGGYEAARLVHFALTVSYVVFLIVHVVQVARAGWGVFWSMVSGYGLAATPDPTVAPSAPDAP